MTSEQFEKSYVQTEPLKVAKQIILVRTDLKMPVGKIAAQVAHASMAALLNYMKDCSWDDDDPRELTVNFWADIDDPRGAPLNNWLLGSFTKVCLAVNSESELDELLNKANDSGLLSSRIVDEGRTCFNGTPTLTCGAIGPAWAEDIDKITGHLKLL